MYSLKEAWVKMHGSLPADNWDGRIYCCETDAAMTFRTDKTSRNATNPTLLAVGGKLLRF